MTISEVMGLNEKRKVNFADVKQQIPCEYFFINYLNSKPKPMGSGVRFGSCPSCGTSPHNSSVKVNVRNNRWNCFACDRGGDVIDAAAFFYGVSHVEAARKLVENTGISEAVKKWKVKHFKNERQVTKSDDQEFVTEVINKLLDAQKDFKLLDEKSLSYLKDKRGIPENILKVAFDQKLLVVLPFNPAEAKAHLEMYVGRELLEKAGMWSADAKAPAIAYRPIAFVTTNKKSIEFRRIRKPISNSDAKCLNYGGMSPYFIEGELKDDYIVVEGAIDLLSILAFGSKRSVIGLPGSKRYKESWFSRMAGRSIMFALDPDKAGLEAIYGRPKHDNAHDHTKIGLLEIAEMYKAHAYVYSFPKNFLETVSEESKDINGLLLWHRNKLN